MAIPSGEIYLLNNVPLTADYQHTFDFDNKNQQFSYWRGYVKYPLLEYSYVRKERAYISVGLTMDQLEDVNYMIFRSSSEERWYYAFVTDKIYVNANTTHIAYSIDVMQTYMFEVTWKPSYIKRSHVDRWDPDHKPIYSRTEEGLDYGSEYTVESGFKIEQDKETCWALITMKDYSSMAGEGLVIDNSKVYPGRSPFVCVLVPFNKYNRTKLWYWHDGINQEGDVKISTLDDVIDFMLNSALGNFIQSIVILPYNPLLNVNDSAGSYVVGTSANMNQPFATTTLTSGSRSITMLVVRERGINQNMVLAKDDWNVGLDDTLPTDKQWEEVKSKPRTTPRDKRFESKLLCSPYRYNILTDWRGSPVIFKNEFMTTDKIEVMFNFGLSHNAPFRYWIKEYRRDPEGRYTSLMQSMALEVPVISDAYYTYMLENKNTIEANVKNATISSIANVGSSVVSGAMSGGVGGAVMGGLMSGVSGAINVTNMIRSENAKQRDLQAKPDTVINSNDSSFNVNDENTVISFYRMKICCENEEILSEIFNISGYNVNRIDIPNTRSRTRFNYIQTLGANVVGSINQSDLLKIREIYDKGITLWHYSEKDFNPLDYSYENIEVNLI